MEGDELPPLGSQLPQLLPFIPPSLQPVMTTNPAHELIGSDMDWAVQLLLGWVDPNQLALICKDHTSSENGNNNNNNNNEGKKVQAATGYNKSKRKYPARVAFHTRSTEDILDDGYKWRKYGQKIVKNTTHPRSYYRCTNHTCNVKKQIQRLSKDRSIVVTTYEGIHNHPCEQIMHNLTPLLKQLHLLSAQQLLIHPHLAS
ncbi:unnamed protein product [Cuscuta europaea]|uniref:WRKY domain-containing protein n=1 Tax=Cuscuta europaea TaxID=41803 RepID=A0A9P0ZPJ4_CUSEU|nr:unnamed protein product [Cuscuta europaea]